MQLKKYGLNLISVTALGIGSVVGAGIFALLGQVIMMAGDQTYYAFIIAGVAALFSGYSYSRLAAAYPDSGGLTDYFHIAFKKRWVVGTFSLIYMMTSAVSICMMAKSFGIYAVKLFPHVQDTNFFINAAACFLIVGLAALNMQRSKDVGNTEIVMVSIKMGILLSLIIAALIHYDIAEKMQTIPFNEVKFMGSIGVTFFAFAGYGVITNAAGDVKNPQRTITWGIFLTILIVIGLYLALAFVALHFIPAKELMANADIAVAVAANRLMGDWGYALMYITAVIAFISGIGATYFSIFRISYTYRQLRVFREVCAKGTVSRAGDDNGMKQSNVSASIADLEANLGLQLFNRIKNKMVLTAAGKDILNYIMGFDRIMYDVKNYKRQNNTLQGTVRLWTSDGLGAGYVSVCLSDFYLQYPQISVDVVCSLERPKNLDKMDICIIYEEPGADMTTVFKGRLKFGLFASLDYLSVFGRPKSIEDLQKNHKICTRDNFASVWPRWKEILDGAQNVVASTNATAVLLSLIRDGNGVSLHPIGSASREKDLVFLSELGYEEEHDFWIATRKDYVQRPEVKVLIECIRDATLKI